MNMRFRTFQDEHYAISTKDVESILPFKNVLVLPQVREPYQALFMYEGKVLPVLGPVPTQIPSESESYDNRAWLLVYGDHAQIVWGLPQIIEAEHSA